MPEATSVYDGVVETTHPLWTCRLCKEKDESKHHNDTFFFFLAAPCGLWDFSSPTRDWTWALGSKCGVLTTGPPGNSPQWELFWKAFWTSGGHNEGSRKGGQASMLWKGWVSNIHRAENCNPLWVLESRAPLHISMLPFLKSSHVSLWNLEFIQW